MERNLGGKSDLRLPFEPVVLVTPWGGALCCDATLVFPVSQRAQPQRRSAKKDGAALATASRGYMRQKSHVPDSCQRLGVPAESSARRRRCSKRNNPLKPKRQDAKGHDEQGLHGDQVLAQHINPLNHKHLEAEFKAHTPESRVH